jgi:hypothetical protein
MKNTSFLKSCLELSALLATACGRFLFKDELVLKLIYMLTATLVWFCYFLYTYRTDKKRFTSWGISFQNFNSTFKELFPFLLFFILLFVLLGYGLNTHYLKLAHFAGTAHLSAVGHAAANHDHRSFYIPVKTVFPNHI